MVQRRPGLGYTMVAIAATLFAALWARFVFHDPVRRRIWAALALSLAGLTLIVEIWHGGRLSGPGVAACGLAATSLAAYFLIAEHGVRRRDPITLSAWGFLFATVFWSLVAPWWNFPRGRVTDDVSLLGNLASSHLPVWALMLWLVVLWTVIPFALVVGALWHSSSPR